MNTQVSVSDKIISAATYITGGTIGIIWLIICMVTKKSLSKFLLFNIYQSIFISFGLYLLTIIYDLVIGIFIRIPFINIIANYINIAVSSPVYYGLSILGIILFIIYLYMIIFSVMGRYAYFPWVSKIISYHLNRY